MKPPAELLAMPADRAARWLALGFLDEAEAAHGRLADPADAGALHDFRVGLRRLRSTVRAYRGQLDASLGKKDRARLRDLARATGAARDAEVHIAWLETRLDELKGEERFGGAWMLERLRDDRAAADAKMRDEAAKDFGRERKRLGRRLRFYEVRIDINDPPGGPPMAAVVGGLVAEAALQAERHLSAARTIADQEEAHEGRIAGKRLRYLLEPFAAEVEGGADAVRRLKKLQDVLGDMHDADVMAAEVRAELEALGVAVPVGAIDGGQALEVDVVAAPDPRPGLHRLVEMLEREREARFAELRAKWLADPAGFFDAFAQIGRALAEAAEPPLEIERKYLLKSMPRLDAAAEVRAIDQGYLPGERLNERLRRVILPDGTKKFYRTVKLGAGISRVELEEETTEAVFRKLWSLTRGRRVRKLRYRVPVGDLLWEIDRFRGRKLVLAEVELPSEDTEVRPPAWLRRLIVRDVTGEPEFLNLNLAR
jgi:CHAD domain-containing protein/CYTH domain-containing protein